MNDTGSANPSQNTGLLTAGVVIAGLVAAAMFLSLRDSGRQSDEAVAVLEASQQEGSNRVVTRIPPTTVPQDVPEAATPAPADDGAAQGAPAQAADATAPTIDEVRVDPLGTMVIAGRAQPGADVDVLVDGEVVTTTKADASGAFAAVGSVTADEGARSLTLRSGAGEGTVASVDEIILAPVPPVMIPPSDTQAQTPAPQTPSDEPDVAVISADLDDAAVRTSEPPTRADVLADVPPETVQQTVSDGGTAASDAPKDPDEVAQADTPADAARTPDAAQDPARSPQIAVLRADDQGVTRVQTAPASRIVLDTISYSDEGAVQLGGRAGTDAVEVRAYLDNRAVARMTVENDGQWRGEIADVAAGVYRLRVDALGQDGAVTSRLETPFKREAPAVLAAATQAASGPIQAVTVQAGDTLWAIARDRYGEGLLYVQVFEANRSEIRDPDLIYPGQVFDLPAD